MKPSPTNTLKPEDDCGEFAVFRDLDALAAYLNHKYGDDALRQVFAAAELSKETLEDTATELENRGLDKPAAILRDIAKDAISGIDLPPDYMVNAGPQFVDFWRMRWLQQRKMHLGIWDQELRQKTSQTAHPPSTTKH